MTLFCSESPWFFFCKLPTIRTSLCGSSIFTFCSDTSFPSSSNIISAFLFSSFRLWIIASASWLPCCISFLSITLLRAILAACPSTNPRTIDMTLFCLESLWIFFCMLPTIRTSLCSSSIFAFCSDISFPSASNIISAFLFSSFRFWIVASASCLPCCISFLSITMLRAILAACPLTNPRTIDMTLFCSESPWFFFCKLPTIRTSLCGSSIFTFCSDTSFPSSSNIISAFLFSSFRLWIIASTSWLPCCISFLNISFLRAILASCPLTNPRTIDMTLFCLESLWFSFCKLPTILVRTCLCCEVASFSFLSLLPAILAACPFTNPRTIDMTLFCLDSLWFFFCKLSTFLVRTCLCCKPASFSFISLLYSALTMSDSLCNKDFSRSTKNNSSLK